MFDGIMKERQMRRMMNGEELKRVNRRRIGQGEEEEGEGKSALVWRIGLGEEMERC